MAHNPHGRMAASRAVNVSIPTGHPHADMRCGGDNMDLRDLPKWIAMYGTMTSNLFKKNIALTSYVWVDVSPDH